MWFNCKTEAEPEIDIKGINGYFTKASLPLYNITYLRNALKKSRNVTKGLKADHFKLTRSIQVDLDKKYASVFYTEPVSITTTVDLSQTPFLTIDDVNAAQKMAELYVVIHCYENSARRLIEDVLTKSLGEKWWDAAASAGMVTKYKDRKAKELKNKWLSNRGDGSPLYYLDWADLVTIIRKYPVEFAHKIHDIKFVELRLEELEKTRNVVAHNGLLPSEDDFQRVQLSFKDWCKQLA
ncbi:hypothetical protein C7T94_10765 [Pedobacter yulinensis]|uniref:Swt1-like HEPN domain-containing protein n=2 Tax=Pedobacter yulinensis TaxID=2126353 RepID=A0A2T3HKZ5_9SPHI|nr:hypothetical protein C7T94_10765 [Pedobacter yulinensis]